MTLRQRPFDPAPATSTQSAGGVMIELQRVQGAPGELLATAITWVRLILPGSAAAHPGVHCLRTTLVEQDNATLWRTCSLLTERESVFRSLKTDRGLCPLFHRADRRVGSMEGQVGR